MRTSTPRVDPVTRFRDRIWLSGSVSLLRTNLQIHRRTSTVFFADIISYGRVEGNPILLPETDSRSVVKSLEVKIVFPKSLADNLGRVRRAVVEKS